MICFTDEEQAAFRQLLLRLMLFDMGAQHGRISIDQQLWRDEVLEPARRLRRVAGDQKQIPADAP